MKKIYLIGFFCMMMFSCRKIKTESVSTGKIIFTFDHRYNHQPMVYDSLIYKNEAGNSFMINQIQYFITNVTLHKSDGSKKILNKKEFWHYIDKDITSMLTWNVSDEIPVGRYDSISFMVGFTKEVNKTGLFVNPPENNMSWPEVIGGGYHYMKINIKYLDTTNFLQSFNFHLGIGQLRNPDSTIIGFIHNNFNVTLPASTFDIEKDKTKEIQIIMNVESWFKTPHTFDFNYWGTCIMQKQQGMKMACENGVDVFTIGEIK